MAEPILVTGATGTIGRRVVDALRASGHDVRPASRTSPCPFDWGDPDSWPAALDGVQAMFLMAPDDVPVEPDFVKLAADTGVERVVLLSSGAIEEMHDERLLEAERLVKESGINWTILRSSWFDQNFDEGFFQPGVMAGAVCMPVGDVRQVFVDAEDVGAVAAVALTADGHAGNTYAVTGPRALTFAEAVATIGEAIGRPLTFDGSTSAYVAMLVEVGMPQEQADLIASTFDGLRSRGDDEPTDTVRRLTGKEPIDFRDYVADAAKRGAWALS
jgi:uncharacterized protein YbjT (DUF2867 family)